MKRKKQTPPQDTPKNRKKLILELLLSDYDGGYYYKIAVKPLGTWSLQDWLMKREWNHLLIEHDEHVNEKKRWPDPPF